jgi:hypothetical protein
MFKGKGVIKMITEELPDGEKKKYQEDVKRAIRRALTEKVEVRNNPTDKDFRLIIDAFDCNQCPQFIKNKGQRDKRIIDLSSCFGCYNYALSVME